MPQRPADLQVEYALTTLAKLYSPTEFNLVAESVMPVIPSEKMTGVYWTYNKQDRFTLPNTYRGPRDSARLVEFGKTKNPYACSDYALGDLVTDRERLNADLPFDENVSTTEGLIDMLMLDREQRVADLMTTTNISQNTTLTGTAQWSDYVNSDPLSDVETGRQTCFYEPNTMVVSREVHQKLKHHPQLLDAIKYTQVGVLTEELLAGLFQVDNYLVANSRINTAKDGQTQTYASVWPKIALLCYTRPSPDLRRPSFGYTIRYNLTAEGGQGGIRVRTAREEKVGGGATYIEVDTSETQQFIATDLAYLITGAVA